MSSPYWNTTIPFGQHEEFPVALPLTLYNDVNVEHTEAWQSVESDFKVTKLFLAVMC